MKSIIVRNPAMEYFLAKFRDYSSSTFECNMCVENLCFFLAGEVSNYLQKDIIKISTPLGCKECSVINEEVILVPILRAGLSMVSGFQRILPKSKCGFIWAQRDENGVAHIDKHKIPDVKKKTVILLDTMLATAGTINSSVDLIMDGSPKQIFSCSILSTQVGVSHLSSCVTANFTVDCSDTLDERLYIYPGVGDSGDRLYGI